MGIKSKATTAAGIVLPFAGATIPAGWLACSGAAVSRATYAALFAAIGTTYGAGDGATTFNLPDLRGRTVFGKDDMGGTAANRLTSGGSGVAGATLGAVGGGETVTLVTAEMPVHNHPDQMGYGAHNAQLTSGPVCKSSLGGATTTDEATAGSGGAHKNIPPALVAHYIIKT